MASGYFTWGEPGLCVKPNMSYLKQVTMGDFNSFLMLFFDNFSSLIGILGGMISAPMIACQFDFTYFDYFAAFKTMVFSQVCPGIGCALLFGNIWYMMMAAKLSTTTGRLDHTALPYGINTPAGFLTVYMVMLPVCFKCAAPRRAARARARGGGVRCGGGRRARGREAGRGRPRVARRGAGVGERHARETRG